MTEVGFRRWLGVEADLESNSDKERGKMGCLVVAARWRRICLIVGMTDFKGRSGQRRSWVALTSTDEEESTSGGCRRRAMWARVADNAGAGTATWGTWEDGLFGGGCKMATDLFNSRDDGLQGQEWSEAELGGSDVD
ncbi:uncharacterized protein A4U43_C02F16210 [Asparagus officinalis]|uniref:Uncharacterized protein n=1 Tax=Asparagus officinalis TaxID=4686 RepID=A0A5P1FMP3_ASPOF|nr:uncharacterized protein A4U43_C02F16210 [Asparagus officinalis]